MKRKSSKVQPATSKRITSWDDAVFDPAQFVKDMRDLADHYTGKRKLTLRTFRVTRPAPKFTPEQIVKLREERELSRPLFARLLNVPDVTVRKWESGERKPSGAALRLLEVMRSTPEALLKLALSKTASEAQAGVEPVIEYQGDKLVSALQGAVRLPRKGRMGTLRSRERDAVRVRQPPRKAKS
jgi:DNA-binding transcriptional regulator YiaG